MVTRTSSSYPEAVSPSCFQAPGYDEKKSFFSKFKETVTKIKRALFGSPYEKPGNWVPKIKGTHPSTWNTDKIRNLEAKSSESRFKFISEYVTRLLGHSK